MKSNYTVMVTVALSVFSFGMAGQTEGCNVFAPIQIAFPGAGDDGGVRPDSDFNDDASSDSGNARIEMRAVLRGPGAEHGDAKYRERGTRMRLNVELEDAIPGSAHGIFVDGVMIGELTIGALGEGEVEFDTKIEPGHVPWPTELSNRLGAGVVIKVGPAMGTLGG